MSRRAKDSTGRTCWTCDCKLSQCPYVKCIRCPEFDQCLECFATAAAVEGHDPDHQFVIMDHIQEPLTREGWSAEEEALLLVGIKMNGIGNWHDIEKVVLTKTALECETHYFETYIEGETAPLPPDKILPELVLPPPLPYDTTPRESRPSISNEQNLQAIGKTEPTTPAEHAGWMPKRCEFEIEYMNEAEELIATLSFSETDETEETLNFKIQQMNEYNETLVDRKFRQKFGYDWGLFEREVQDLGGQTPEERAVDQTLMPMAQVVPRPVLLDFASALRDEMRSAADLNMLATWKRNGIATLDEGFLFNKLQSLINAKEPLTEQQVEEWNNDVLRFVNSTEFRATLDREIMTDEENELTKELQIAPSSFLKLKDLLIRENMLRGSLSEDDLRELAKGNERIVIPIYRYLLRSGLFLTSNDFANQTEALKAAQEALEQDS